MENDSSFVDQSHSQYLESLDKFEPNVFKADTNGDQQDLTVVNGETRIDHSEVLCEESEHVEQEVDGLGSEHVEQEVDGLGSEHVGTALGTKEEAFGCDLTEQFTTDQVFESRDSFIRWARDLGKKYGCVLAIMKSDHTRLQIACERGGKYRVNKQLAPKKETQGKPVKSSKTRTKKCGCPFLLKGIHVADSVDEWKVRVESGRHNHPLAIYSEGHSYVGRLTPTEESLVIEMTKSGVKPQKVLNAIKERNPHNFSTARHIYNARAKLKAADTGGRSQMQQLTTLLGQNGYMFWSRRDEETKVVKDIFFVHPESVQLAKCFPYVFLMYSTYKTNKHKWPLFQVLGLTSTLMTFFIAFALFEEEKQDNYLWALEQLRSLLDEDAHPSVIVTDTELALMNGIEKVFPHAKHLLCRRHIEKNVLANLREGFPTKQLQDKFNVNWNHLVMSSTMDEYESRLKTFEQDFVEFQNVLDYVKDTLLIPYKEKFVTAWTDQILHFGTTTTGQAETAHVKRKKDLKNGRSDFVTLWRVIHPLVNGQITQIRAAFERSLNTTRHEDRVAALKELRGFVSREAIDLILQEKGHYGDMGLDVFACSHVLRRTHELPCAHEMFQYEREGRAIPLSSIHALWKKLSVPTPKGRGDLDNYPEFQIFAKRFEESDENVKQYLLKRLKELVTPPTSWLVEPLENTNPHGRSKGSQKTLSQVESSSKREPSLFEHVLASPDMFVTPEGSILILSLCAPQSPQKKKQKVSPGKKAQTALALSSLPSVLHPFISDIIDVPADGHCGFRAVAVGLGVTSPDAWKRVREDLLMEMEFGKHLYTQMFGGEREFHEVRRTIEFGEGPCDISKWMLIPETGHLIASRYDMILVFVSKRICLTFLPLRSVPSPNRSVPLIAIGLVNDCHFVNLILKPGCPIPPPPTLWTLYRSEEADSWVTPLLERIDRFKELIPSNVAIVETFDALDNADEK